jgi:hypothetical protein
MTTSCFGCTTYGCVRWLWDLIDCRGDSSPHVAMVHMQMGRALSMGRTLSKDALMLLNDALQPAACLPNIPEQQPATAVRLTNL